MPERDGSKDHVVFASSVMQEVSEVLQRPQAEEAVQVSELVVAGTWGLCLCSLD
jgi:hypothetical protein